MNQQRKHELKEHIASRARKIADPGLQALVAFGAGASTDAQLATFAGRALRPAIPAVLEQLKAKMTPVIARIDSDIERAERERTMLGRRSVDDLMGQLDESMQIAMDILRRVMPEGALAHANIEFAESVSLPIKADLRSAVEQSEKAQEALFLKCVSQAREVMESFYVESVAAISAADKRMGGGVFMKPAQFRYRPPEHFFIDFYAVLDRYEQVRVSTQGMSQVHNIRPKWFRDLLLRLPRIVGMDLGEIIGGVSGFDSLGLSKRVQLRRELTSIAAEQRRRVMATVHEQAATYFRELKSNVLAQSRRNYFATYDALTERLSKLSKERRQALDYWGTTERSLREAEAYARELLTLTAAAEREVACIG